MRKKRFVGDEILDIFSTNISYFKLISNKISYAYLISRVKELNKKFSSPAMNNIQMLLDPVPSSRCGCGGVGWLHDGV